MIIDDYDNNTLTVDPYNVSLNQSGRQFQSGLVRTLAATFFLKLRVVNTLSSSKPGKQ